jgi:diguanylate cyclase (GGDEF)-like protein
VTGRRTAYAASLTVAVVLLGLAVATAVGFFTVMQANHRVTAARAMVVVHLDLEQALAAEAAAEAGYRRAPSPMARIVFQHAVHEVERAIAEIPDERDGRPLALPAELSSLNERYVAEVLRTLDVRPRGIAVDRAGPALTTMQRLVDQEVVTYRSISVTATEAQEVMLRRLAVVLPTVFALAFALFAFGLRRMLLDRRRLHVEAARSRSLAETDPLTGLANRSHLETVMGALLARPRTPGALLYLDLDRFKPVNDRLGHHAGDLVLVEVARRLRETVRAGATVARVGGDEFVVVLPECATPRLVATRIAEAVEAPIHVQGESVTVGTSVGIATYPDTAADLNGLLQAADGALYAAKRAGRGGIVRAAGRAPDRGPSVVPTVRADSDLDAAACI